MDRPLFRSTGPVPLGARPELVPTLTHWVMLGTLILFGGSSFSGIRIAVETAPPAIVAAGRLWVGTLTLFLYMQLTGRSMIRLRTENGKIDSVWKYALAIGAFGYAIPMTLFPYAQQTVSSMLAGIYMAFMPLVTVFLAAAFADEPLTRRKLVGFLAGTLGVIVLLGPGTLTNIFSESVLAQGALLLASTGYAVATIFTRRAPSAPARSFAVAFMLCASILCTPSAILALAQHPEISAASLAAIVYLGIVPTGFAAILIVQIIRGAGAGFMGMGNYVTPFVAIVFGIALFGEVLHWRYVLGLAVIIAGLSVAQPEPSRIFRRWLRSQLDRYRTR